MPASGKENPHVGAAQRGVDRPNLDTAYNNRAAVPDAEAILLDWAQRSARVRCRPDACLDLVYGPAKRQRIDFFPGPTDRAPVVAFIHGGYWQRNSKEDFAFVAEGPLAHGLAVAVIGYTLAPACRIGGIVAEIGLATAWLRGVFGVPLYVAGWSAGGHLAASIIGDGSVRGGLAISGIYDLEPLRRTYLNDALRLDSAEAALHSPIRHPPASAPPLVIAYGGEELPELRRQSREYWATWQRAVLPGALIALEGHHHFSVLEELARPDGTLARALVDMIGSHV